MTRKKHVWVAAGAGASLVAAAGVWWVADRPAPVTGASGEGQVKPVADLPVEVMTDAEWQAEFSPAPTPSTGAVTDAGGPAPVDVKAGDFLDGPAALPGGLLAYEMADGKQVAIDPKQVLPPVVVADLVAVADERVEDGMDMFAKTDALWDLAADVEERTGRGLAAVSFTPATNPDGEAVGAFSFWGLDDGNATEQPGFDTSDEAAAAAQKWADAHGGDFTVLVIPPDFED